MKGGCKMDFRIEWDQIFMILGAAVGCILAVIFYAVTSNDYSLTFFPVLMFGGYFVGWVLKRFILKK
jgi:hypothetical protein